MAGTVPASNNDTHVGDASQSSSSFTTTADLTIGDDLTITDDLAVGGDVSVTGNVAIVGTLTQTGNVTFDAATAIDGGKAITLTKEIVFTETSGTGTTSGTISLPAGSRIIDIGVDGTQLWSATTAASIVVGDAASANGFFTATNLKATDLLAGEINNIEHPGGLAGAYIASEQRVLYQATARTIIATVSKGGTGTSGRTRVYVTYSVPSSVAGA